MLYLRINERANSSRYSITAEGQDGDNQLATSRIVEKISCYHTHQFIGSVDFGAPFDMIRSNDQDWFVEVEISQI